MLRIEEIVGAMEDEFRYALDALSDDQLAELAADRAALRRLRPVGVSHAEAMAMIAAVQARRQAARDQTMRKERRKAARRKAAPRKPRPKVEAAADAATVAQPVTAEAPSAPWTTTATLPPPPLLARLAPPRPGGPAIRLPPPATDGDAIPLPAPKAAPLSPPVIPKGHAAPHYPANLRLFVIMLVLAVLIALALAIL